MSRLGVCAGLLLGAALAGCDAGADDRPAFRVEVTGDAEAVLVGRPFVTRIPEADGGGVVLTLADGFSSVGLVVGEPVAPGPRSLTAPLLFLATGDGVRGFAPRGGTLTVEAVDGPLVRARFAFAAVDGEDRVGVEGTVTADLGAAVDLPVLDPPQSAPRR